VAVAESGAPNRIVERARPSAGAFALNTNHAQNDRRRCTDPSAGDSGDRSHQRDGAGHAPRVRAAKQHRVASPQRRGTYSPRHARRRCVGIQIRCDAGGGCGGSCSERGGGGRHRGAHIVTSHSSQRIGGVRGSSSSGTSLMSTTERMRRPHVTCGEELWRDDRVRSVGTQEIV